MLGESSSVKTKIFCIKVIRMAGGLQGISGKREYKGCKTSFGSFQFCPGFIDGCIDMRCNWNFDTIDANVGCDDKVIVDSVS